jgi:hypothetical protein
VVKIARRIVMLHPAIISAAIMIGYAMPLFVQILPLHVLLKGALYVFPFVAMCTWIWAVFHVANRTLPHPRSHHWGWVFAAPPAIIFVAGSAGWSTNNSPSAFAFFISLFVAITLAAKALEKAHDPDGNPSVGRMLGTALLMYFAPVGVFALHGRVLRVASRSL